MAEIYGEDGHIYERRLPDGRSIFVDALTFNRARLHIGETHAFVYDDAW